MPILKAEKAFSSENPGEALIVVKDLAEVTAPKDTPQFPQDLNITNDIITKTLNLLIQKPDEGEETTNATNVRKPCIFDNLISKGSLIFSQSTVIFETLDNILSESNQISFSSLQEVGVGSQSVLQNTESYGLYAAKVLEQQMGTGQTLNITGNTMGI